MLQNTIKHDFFSQKHDKYLLTATVVPSVSADNLDVDQNQDAFFSLFTQLSTVILHVCRCLIESSSSKPALMRAAVIRKKY